MYDRDFEVYSKSLIKFQTLCEERLLFPLTKANARFTKNFTAILQYRDIGFDFCFV